ncbi:MAG: ThiF family adenylyltransferase [Bacteroidia bacterium]|nr:ThiF family adenylyltransferase [Bacteroidia bacterium]
MALKLYSNSLKPYEGGLSKYVHASLLVIGRLLGKRKLKVYEWDENHIAIPVTINVELPPRGNYSGIDIKKKEPILIVFDINCYPRKAPKAFSDRLDFPKDALSHLYVAKDDRPAPLCLIRGSIDEWFAEKEIGDYVLQIQSWFSDAASGALVEDGNQFDPIRLEGYRGTSIYKYKEIADVVNSNQSIMEGQNFALALFLETEKETDNSFPSFKMMKVIPNADEFKKAVELLKQVSDSKNGLVDKNLQFGLIVWNKELKPTSDYFVNLPRNFNELIEFGKKTNIDFLSGLFFYFSPHSLKLIDNIPVLAGIKRSKKIIGYNSDIEFVNFYITVKDADLKDGTIVNNVPVSFQMHNEPLSVEKAKEISNYDNQLGNVLIFGAGALGSKVIMNFARGGHTDITIVDGDKLSPHNLVRHALLSGQIGKSKSVAVKAAISELYRHDTLPNLVSRNIDGEEMFIGENRKSIAQFNWLFDFTASKRLQNFLARETISEPINICKGSLMNEGKLGVLLVEGKNRNPRVDDLQILLYDLYKREKFVSEYLQTEFEKSKDEKSLVSVGVGCNSETTILADEIVSLHAAAFCNVIKKEAHRSTFSDNGFIYLTSITTEHGFKVESHSFQVSSLIVMKCGDWEIRFKSNIPEILKSEMGKALPHETGGVFIGIINKKTKCIYVTDVLLAPLDSEANEVCFFRGVEGLPEEIDKIKKMSGQTFGYIGEWHSHPFGPMGLSNVDMRTVKKFLNEFRQLQNPIPVFITIVTPYGLHPFVIE